MMENLIDYYCSEIREVLSRMQGVASYAERVIPRAHLSVIDWLPGCLLADAEFCQILLKRLAGIFAESTCTESEVSSGG